MSRKCIKRVAFNLKYEVYVSKARSQFPDWVETIGNDMHVGNAGEPQNVSGEIWEAGGW